MAGGRGHLSAHTVQKLCRRRGLCGLRPPWAGWPALRLGKIGSPDAHEHGGLRAVSPLLEAVLPHTPPPLDQGGPRRCPLVCPLPAARASANIIRPLQGPGCSGQEGTPPAPLLPPGPAGVIPHPLGADGPCTQQEPSYQPVRSQRLLATYIPSSGKCPPSHVLGRPSSRGPQRAPHPPPHPQAETMPWAAETSPPEASLTCSQVGSPGGGAGTTWGVGGRRCLGIKCTVPGSARRPAAASWPSAPRTSWLRPLGADQGPSGGYSAQGKGGRGDGDPVWRAPPHPGPAGGRLTGKSLSPIKGRRHLNPVPMEPRVRDILGGRRMCQGSPKAIFMFGDLSKDSQDTRASFVVTQGCR